ncbi:MAG: hypothetical protein WCE81_05370 [Halobacteriota archaeon]
MSSTPLGSSAHPTKLFAQPTPSGDVNVEHRTILLHNGVGECTSTIIIKIGRGSKRKTPRRVIEELAFLGRFKFLFLLSSLLMDVTLSDIS